MAASKPKMADFLIKLSDVLHKIYTLVKILMFSDIWRPPPHKNNVIISRLEPNSDSKRALLRTTTETNLWG